MKQNILVAIGALAIGLILGGNLAQGQLQEAAAPPIWPPNAEKSIVNESGIKDFGKTNQTQVLYIVPDDRWLVITDFRTTKKKKELFPEPDLMMRMPGTKDNVMVLPWQLSDPYYSSGSPVGLRFPPKSQVVLQRAAAGSSSLGCHYFFSGYLTE